MSYIKSSQLTDEMLTNQPMGIPVILCSPNQRILKKIEDAGYIELKLNKKLAESLVKFPIEDRSANVTQEVQKILSDANGYIFLKDYEMLFDPSYELDVIRFICDISKFLRIVVMWCGTCSNGVLEYAEPGYPDYQRFEINRYTVVCVK